MTQSILRKIRDNGWLSREEVRQDALKVLERMSPDDSGPVWRAVAEAEKRLPEVGEKSALELVLTIAIYLAEHPHLMKKVQVEPPKSKAASAFYGTVRNRRS